MDEVTRTLLEQLKHPDWCMMSVDAERLDRVCGCGLEAVCAALAPIVVTMEAQAASQALQDAAVGVSDLPSLGGSVRIDRVQAYLHDFAMQIELGGWSDE